MYWYRLKQASAAALTALLIALFTACKPEIKETGATLKYFDLKGYFIADLAALKKLNKPVTKTVTHNGATESKTLHITSWAQEMDLFAGSDINKPAWKDSYTVVNNGDFLIYKAKFPELKTRELTIKKVNGKVKWILIYNRTKNILYQTTEKLSYFPDSVYVIEKVQKVKLMGSNSYKITGVIGR
ncbi:hypothetical protein BH09BAC6_BH09BAC6_08890 [soil metagenome]|jgi:hypothetical protein